MRDLGQQRHHASLHIARALAAGRSEIEPRRFGHRHFGAEPRAKLREQTRHGQFRVQGEIQKEAKRDIDLGLRADLPIRQAILKLQQAQFEQAHRVFGWTPHGDQVRAGVVMLVEQIATLGACCAILLWPHLKRAPLRDESVQL